MTKAIVITRPIRVLGIVSLLVYGGWLGLSTAFWPETTSGPLQAALILFLLATITYFLALATVLRQETDEPGLLRTVFLFAVGYRLLLWPSAPIQEIDFYRYLWDGRAVQAGLNPYRLSPQQIEDDGPLGREGSELADWWQAANQSESVRQVFDSVHYRGVPTAYPPLAQAVFALSAFLTPAHAPVFAHILVWKALLLAFDIGTLFLLVLLLRQLQLPASWCLAYGWCPLALKEFANSGHFDAIAIFFTVLAALLLVRITSDQRSPVRIASLAMTALALAVLAKSYPIILLPVALAFLVARIGWRTLVPTSAFMGVLIVGYLPFTRSALDDPPSTHHAGSGLNAFLTQWEINDLLFMVVQENLRPAEADRWFVLTPAVWRESVHQYMLDRLGELEAPAQVSPAFVLTLLVMGALLASLCAWWAVQVWRDPSPQRLLRGLFLSLAWSWLLTSAANPWYLLWSLPFMLFAGRRSWFLLTGLAFLYYLRSLLGSDGTFDRFDYGWVWLEYAPFFVALIVETLFSGRPRVGAGSIPSAPAPADSRSAAKHELQEAPC